MSNDKLDKDMEQKIWVKIPNKTVSWRPANKVMS
jgi:hypothetical protein